MMHFLCVYTHVCIYEQEELCTLQQYSVACNNYISGHSEYECNFG